MKLLAFAVTIATMSLTNALKIPKASHIEEESDESEQSQSEFLNDQNYVPMTLADIKEYKEKAEQQAAQNTAEEEDDETHHFEETVAAAEAQPAAEAQNHQPQPQRKLKEDKNVKGSDQELERFLGGIKAFAHPDHIDFNEKQNEASETTSTPTPQ